MEEMDLHDVLDAAAREFDPQPNPDRLAALLTHRCIGRRAITWVGIAAALALLAGSASALTVFGSGEDVRPAGERIEVTPDPESSLPSTSTDVVDADNVDEHGAEDEVPSLTSTVASTLPSVGLDPNVVVDRGAASGPGRGPRAAAPPAPGSADAEPPQSSAPETSSSVPHTSSPTTTSPSSTHPPTTTVGFSAHQMWGSCDLDPPYDQFYGTAPAGSVVSVTSPYGSGTTTADGAGHWELTVYFPTAPVGVPFTVTVSGINGSATFTFTRT